MILWALSFVLALSVLLAISCIVWATAFGVKKVPKTTLVIWLVVLLGIWVYAMHDYLQMKSERTKRKGQNEISIHNTNRVP